MGHAALRLHLPLKVRPSPFVSDLAYADRFASVSLSRSWAVDQRPLSIHLKRLARLAVETSQPVWIMIFPEGTIGSDDERPKSQKWAAREGIVRPAHAVNDYLPPLVH